MDTTSINRTLTPAGFAPAGKPANRQERLCHTAQSQRECRGRPTQAPRLAGLLWLACALAAMGISPAHAQTATETVLHNFGSNPADGVDPTAGVIGDSDGNLYGTTTSGGTAGQGVVYKLDPAIQSPGGWLETVLYTFTGGADGGNPQAGVIHDSEGNLYGTSYGGGDLACGFNGSACGTVFKLDPTGTETVLHRFTGGADGSYPAAGVIRDSAGNLYGTASQGGPDYGVVYKLDTGGHEAVLYSFTGGTDGSVPDAGVIGDSSGNIYGTTSAGGTAGWGVAYKLDAARQETVLYSFTGEADGGEPNAGVVRDSAGNLYGTTLLGGNTVACPSSPILHGGCGVVYKLDRAGNESVLYSFTGGADGGYPTAGVIRDSAGNLYGTTSNYFGAGGYGVVYKLDTAGNYTVLYSFTGGNDGGNPFAGVIRDSAGNLDGTTRYGGKEGGGVVFRVKPR